MSKWKTPFDFAQNTISVFGPPLDLLLPETKDIPANYENKKQWEDLIQRWFFQGLSDVKMEPKEGVDPQYITRHIGIIIQSFEPKHEHKVSGAAWLLSLWLESIETVEISIPTIKGKSK